MLWAEDYYALIVVLRLRSPLHFLFKLHTRGGVSQSRKTSLGIYATIHIKIKPKQNKNRKNCNTEFHLMTMKLWK